jgi:hypothetical protein
MSDDRNESSFSFESPQQHSPRPSSSTLVLDSTPAPKASALAKAEGQAAYWLGKVEALEDDVIRRDALGHGLSSASAEDQSSYREARDNVRLMSAQYAQAQERVNLLRGMFLPSYGAGPSATASTTPATPATPATAATPTSAVRVPSDTTSIRKMTSSAIRFSRRSSRSQQRNSSLA